jgi:hypothetical protein
MLTNKKDEHFTITELEVWEVKYLVIFLLNLNFFIGVSKMRKKEKLRETERQRKIEKERDRIRDRETTGSVHCCYFKKLHFLSNL